MADKKGNIKIFITGATGFIGKRLAKNLSRKYKLICLYRQKNKIFKSRNIIWLKGDLMALNPEIVRSIRSADLIIHLAGTSSMFDQNCLKLNLEGTKNIFKSLDKDKERRLIYASSIEAYGPTGRDEVDEKSREEPLTVYGRSKLLAEKEIIKYSKKNKNFSYLILRIGNVEADGFFRKYSNNKIINIFFGNYELNVVSLRKVIELIGRIIVKENYGNRIRFLTGKPMSLNAMNGRQNQYPYWYKLAMVLLIQLMKLIKKGGIWYYLAAGGGGRPYRRYSNKIYRELGVLL